MAMFRFSADAQLMFSVQTVTGGQVLIHFTETDSWGRSAFLTTNEAVARAIMAHSFFKHGRIELVSSEQDQDTVVFSEPEKTVDDTPVTEEPEAETAQPEVQETTEDDSNLVFANITIAKDYLNRRFGVNKSDIRSMTKVMAFAESKGLNITIGGGEE